jgi:hypothetical protein
LSEKEQTTLGKQYAAKITQAYNNQDDGVNTRSSVASKWSSCSYEEQHDFIQSIISNDVSLSGAAVVTAQQLDGEEDSSGEEEDDVVGEDAHKAMENELAKQGE